MEVQRPPVPPLLRMADEIEALVTLFLRERRGPSGRWEALDEAHVMGNLCVRHIEGTIELARVDMVLLPAAWSTARSALEIAARLWWLLVPAAEFDREARWLARVHEGARYWHQLGDRLAGLGGDPTRFHQTSLQMTGFADDVAKKLPTTVAVPKLPTLDAIIAELDPVQYVVYKMASQYTHGTHEGGTLYRRNLGIAKEFGERIAPAQWADPLRCCWWARRGGLARAVGASGGDPATLLAHETTLRLESAVAELTAWEG